MKQRKLTKKTNVDTSKFIDSETGETLSSYLNLNSDKACVQVPSGDYVQLKSKDFCIIESSALDYLKENLSKSDLGYIYLMANMVYGSLNALHTRERKFHTRNTLMVDLELARTQFSSLINRLIEKGVLYELKGLQEGGVSKVFILNPSLARRTNTVNAVATRVFKNLSQDDK